MHNLVIDESAGSSIFTRFIFLSLFIFLIGSCSSDQSESDKSVQNYNQFVATLESHLAAISEKSFESLLITLPTDNEFFLILPGSDTRTQKSEFIKYHEDWFHDTTWTFDSKITHTEIGDEIGIAIVDIIYKEPSRDGKPYFNHMIVSYALKKYDSQWRVFLDHASSIEKTSG
ncbi:MAG: nuclear transport factor 2 family protein [Candidatus Marinimicrobia bacterium]|nr:nuclear transport factor 2 family protein [Candidatus Neomarinimicrobiota bacterium]